MTSTTTNRDVKAWHQIEQKLQEFACRLIVQFVPTTHPDAWRRFLIDNHPSHQFREKLKGKKSLEVVEAQDLLRVLGKLIYKSPPPSKAVSLQGKHDLPDSLPETLDYVTSLRNKNDHAVKLSPQEQLADLILVQQVVAALECAEPRPGNETDALKQLLSQLITQYLDRATGSGGIESPEPDTDEDVAALKQLIGDLAGKMDEMGSKISAALAPPRITEQSAGDGPRQARDKSVEVVPGDAAAAPDSAATNQSRNTGSYLTPRTERQGTTTKAVRERTAQYTPRTLSGPEVRDQLIGLRWRIWKVTGSGPSANGLLRKRMIEMLVSNRVTDDESFQKVIPAQDRLRIDRRQLEFLPHVYEIIAAMS